MWPSTTMSEEMINRLEKNEFPYHFEHIAIQGSHSAPLDHFDKIEAFLLKHFKQDNLNNCVRKP